MLFENECTSCEDGLLSRDGYTRLRDIREAANKTGAEKAINWCGVLLLRRYAEKVKKGRRGGGLSRC
jgi:hypothetical protein